MKTPLTAEYSLRWLSICLFYASRNILSSNISSDLATISEASDYPELLDGSGGKASDCIACGQCEGVCPQHIPIIENLKMIAEHIE